MNLSHTVGCWWNTTSLHWWWRNREVPIAHKCYANMTLGIVCLLPGWGQIGCGGGSEVVWWQKFSRPFL